MKNISNKLSGVTLKDVKKVEPRLELDLVTKHGLLPIGEDCENNADVEDFGLVKS